MFTLLRLLMAGLLSIINVYTSQLKLIFRRRSALRYYSSVNSALSSITLSEDETSTLEDTVAADNDDICEPVDTGFLFSINERPDEDEMKRLMLILAKRGWNLGCQNGYNIYLNQLNIIDLLNDLFEESLDAKLVLYFFKWSECCSGSKHTIQTICRMIHILVSGNLNHRAVDLILHLVRNHGDEESCIIRIKAVGIGMGFSGSYADRGMGLNAAMMSLFINKYCSEGDLESGWKLLLEMKNYGIQPDVVSFTIVINSLCKMSYLNEATALLFKMTQLGISPDPVLLSSIIDGHCKLGQTEVAISILKIFNTSLNIFIYNSFISKLCTDGNMVEASSLFHEMSLLGLLPDCFCYSTIIDGYCKVRDIDRAFQYFGKMLKNGITPCVTTYTSLIDAYCKSGNMETAEYSFHKMISAGLAPDVVTFNTLMDGFGRRDTYKRERRIEEANVLFHKMLNIGLRPDLILYNTLIMGIVVLGAWMMHAP
ncbi:unnamed protein product [Prunus armeniaca]|uniref:Pentacotripeptide-repeat region of PRORP domain-containing protein n=1 Tax=Prunus armeniaca TaxID=36596 RepID=A0A6J5TZY9_PRUAR|nr:unnamed protein product [Prunus armeniaca]